MPIIKKTIDVSKKPTESQLEMLRKAEASPVSYDDDCPTLTKEQLSLFQKANDIAKSERTQNRKQNITIRLSPQTIVKAKSFGKGYTSILARILENALNDPETIKNNL